MNKTLRKAADLPSFRKMCYLDYFDRIENEKKVKIQVDILKRELNYIISKLDYNDLVKESISEIRNTNRYHEERVDDSLQVKSITKFCKYKGIYFLSEDKKGLRLIFNDKTLVLAKKWKPLMLKIIEADEFSLQSLDCYFK